MNSSISIEIHKMNLKLLRREKRKTNQSSNLWLFPLSIQVSKYLNNFAYSLMNLFSEEFSSVTEREKKNKQTNIKTYIATKYFEQLAEIYCI